VSEKGAQIEPSGRASGLTDRLRRMRQVIASVVAPMPTIDILPVPASPGGDHSFLIIAVLLSPLRPHAGTGQ
jgi:hypothetical protein